MTLSATPASSPPADPDDVPSNPSRERPFAELAQARLARRTVLTGGMLAAAGFLTTGLAGAPAAAAAPSARGRRPLLGFPAIPPSADDVVVVPPGYTARPFIPWGTPLSADGPAFVPGHPDAGVPGGNTADDQAQQTVTDGSGSRRRPPAPDHRRGGRVRVARRRAPGEAVAHRRHRCEITGVITTPDRRTTFTNVEHPGEDGGSTSPRPPTASTPPDPPPSWSPSMTAA